MAPEQSERLLVVATARPSRTYLGLLAHLENPATIPPPGGLHRPLYKADRPAEVRAAHAHFQKRLDDEIAAGRWTPPGGDSA